MNGTAEMDTEDLFVRWGLWLSRRDTGGLGFPKICPTFRLEERGPVRVMTPVPDDIMQCDRFVAGLKHSDHDLHDTAMLYYARAFPASSIARMQRTSERTVYKRIERLKKFFEENA